MYEYKATVTDVYDGDTITADVDLGFGTWLKGQKFRLLGINAPEMYGPSVNEAMRAKNILKEMVQGKTVTIRTVKDKKEKYGRWLAQIQTDKVADVGRALIDAKAVTPM